MNEKLKRLLTPEGVRDLLPETAGQKRVLEGSIQEIFGRWGYREVSTPAFEYSANFVGDMKDDLEEKVYRLLDERGRTLVLRPDFTIPLARVAAMHLANEPKPLRLCYGGSIYRYAAGQQGKQRELAQAGVELMGATGAGSDAEMIALAVEVLQTVGLREFTLCLGHSGFLENLLTAYGLAPQDKVNIKALFNRKDFVSLKEQVHMLPLSDEAKNNILRVPTLRGGRAALQAARELMPTEQDVSPLATLEEIWDVLEEYGVTEYVTLDLGLVRLLDYYTGMVFEGYTGGLGYPICGGGRYDQLLENFGPELPAVGFAVSLDYLLAVLARQKKLPVMADPVFVAYDTDGRAAAVAAAQALRSKRDRVIVDVTAATEKEAQTRAVAHGACRLLYYSSAGGKEVELQENKGGAGC